MAMIRSIGFPVVEKSPAAGSSAFAANAEVASSAAFLDVVASGVNGPKGARSGASHETLGSIG